MEIVAIMWGDPHIQTLDKLEYTFNGLGEYFMVKSDSLELQARTARAWDNQRQPSVTGTVFSAVAGRALYEESNTTVSSAPVHVEMSADRTTGRLTCAYLVLTLCGLALRSTRMTRPRVQRTSP